MRIGENQASVARNLGGDSVQDYCWRIQTFTLEFEQYLQVGLGLKPSSTPI